MTDLELDALVAEKVMGFTVRDGWIFEWRPSPCPDKMPGCLVLHSKEYPVLPRPYSTDIAEAWQVVEKIKQMPDDTIRRFVWEIEVSAYNGDTTEAQCRHGRGHYPSALLEMIMPHPRTVCLALLKAMGVKVGE